MRFVGILAACLAGLAALSGRALADDPDLLYRAVAVVTGTGEENRQIGFRLCMEDVVVRVPGDYRLIASGKAKPMIDDAASYVARFKYHDRYEGIPVHDEQGTHDRPHDLTVDFDRGKVDAALAQLGSKPWLDPRPRLVVILGVTNPKGSFVLSADAEQGFYMRDSFALASGKIAIPIAFPRQSAIAAAALDPVSLGESDLAALDALAKAAGGDQALAGTLVWSDAERGWIAKWRPRRARCIRGGSPASASTTPSATRCAVLPRCFPGTATPTAEMVNSEW
jgi:hypothetical protein